MGIDVESVVYKRYCLQRRIERLLTDIEDLLATCAGFDVETAQLSVYQTRVKDLLAEASKRPERRRRSCVDDVCVVS